MEPTGVEGRTAEPMQRPGTDDSHIGAKQEATGTPRQEARQRGKRWAAEIAGALEGFLESLERYDVERLAKDAMHEEAALASAVADEAHRQARTPEMKDLGRDLRHGAQNLRSSASKGMDRMGSGLERGTDRMESGLHRVESRLDDAMHAVQDQWHEVREDIEHGVERVQEMGHIAVDETKERSHLVARAGRRAREAPKHVLKDTRQALGSWGRGLAAGIGLYVAAGIVGLAMFVVLTVALVAGMNSLVGAPEGTFLVALLYAIVAAGCVVGARAARRRAKEQSAEHMDDARRELQNVARPLRKAFSKHKITHDEPAAVPAAAAPDDALVLKEHEWRRR